MRGRPLQLCAQRVFVRRLRKDLQLCAQGPAAVCTAVKDRRDLQLSAQIKLWFCSKLNKTQFVDVAPTLGVNHVIFGVVVYCVVSISVILVH